MIAAGNTCNAGQIVAFDNRNFEVVNEFVYLGDLVTAKNDVGWRYSEE
jgi:hypothetical protein